MILNCKQEIFLTNFHISLALVKCKTMATSLLLETLRFPSLHMSIPREDSSIPFSHWLESWLSSSDWQLTKHSNILVCDASSSFYSNHIVQTQQIVLLKLSLGNRWVHESNEVSYITHSPMWGLTYHSAYWLQTTNNRQLKKCCLNLPLTKVFCCTEWNYALLPTRWHMSSDNVSPCCYGNIKELLMCVYTIKGFQWGLADNGLMGLNG